MATTRDSDGTAGRQGGLAVIFGAGGAIGGAMERALNADARFEKVMGLSRSSEPPLDLTDEDSIARAADSLSATGLPVRLAVDATGYLHGPRGMPEKSWRHLDPAALAYAFAVNAIGPALLMKHVLPLMPRQGKSVFATLSARVGSIGDNHLGGWYGYRASKAALNQLVRTASIELGRKRPEAIIVALHPGTVKSGLSAPFSKDGLTVRAPEEAARDLLRVIDGLAPDDSGRFYDYAGKPVGW